MLEGSKKNKGLKAKNPNLEFVFYHMKTNQYRAMKMHSPSFIFFGFYWLDFIYRIVYYITKRKYTMLRVGYKVILKNFK